MHISSPLLPYRTAMLITMLVCSTCLHAGAQQADEGFLKKLLSAKESPLLNHVLNNPDSFQYQIIYTQIDRDKQGKPHFTSYYLHVDSNLYFNPASTVKLPTALASLEKLRLLKNKGIDVHTVMLTDSSYSGQSSVTADSSAANNLPSVAQYIKKIFLVSDNDAYNRLYEFTGQQFLNQSLWSKGHKNVRITRRFVPMSEDENRHTNGIRFVNNNGQLLYAQPAAYSDIKFDFSKKVLVGNAHFDWNDSLINTPFDFTTHNNLPLADLQQMLQSVIFPESVAPAKRFNINEDDRQMVLNYMSELPSESQYPKYDTAEYFDSYAKFFMYKADRQKPDSNIRIFNKPGWSYGYLTDAAYIIDFLHKTEFMLSANIYVNRDGVLNDNKYEYNEIGYPFFKEIGNIIYQYELTRKRKYKPDLSQFRFTYK